jgi:glycosyltransferase involved in cell wall biosynthesis
MKIAFLTTDSREHYGTYSEPNPYFGTAPSALLQGFAQLPEIEVHVISCARAPMQSPEKLAENIWFHGLHVGKLGWMRTLYRGCATAVRRKLRELQPDLVHGQGTERDCALSAVRSGFPNVLTIHGNMRAVARVMGARPFSFYWLAARLEASAVARTRGVVCITNYTRRMVGGLARRAWVVPNAVDPSFFEIEPAPDPAVTLLSVANVQSFKNQNALILALDGVAKNHRFNLVFLGGAPEVDPYAAEFLRLVKARPWCRHAGFASRAVLKEHLRRATLLVHPSLEDNCPMAVLEAMAAGVPVAAGNIGGIPDLVEPEKTGLLFNPRDPADMRGAVERFLKEADLARRMGAAARLAARERFDPKVIAQRHVAIYRETLGKDS